MNAVVDYNDFCKRLAIVTDKINIISHERLIFHVQQCIDDLRILDEQLSAFSHKSSNMVALLCGQQLTDLADEIKMLYAI